MFIKQFYPYVLDAGEKEKITHEALSECAFVPPSGLEWFTEGFVCPVNVAGNEYLVFKVQNTLQVALQKEEKVLPAGVINDVVNEKIQVIEAEENRSVNRKEKQSLKEQVTDDLLPRAFTKKSIRRGFITNRFLLVDKASSTQSEAFLTKIRQVLGGLNATLPRTKQPPSSLMTSWLHQKEAAGNFVLDTECELKGAGDTAAKIRASKQDLTSDELDVLLETKTVTRLGLIWADKIRFVLHEDLSFTKVQFLDVLQEEASDEGEDRESLLAATQLICTRELENMLLELIDLLGGLSKQD